MTPAPVKRKTRRTKSKKGFFVRGLVVLLPTVLTIFVFVMVINFVDRYLTSPINSTIYGFLEGNGAGWQVLSVMEVDPYDREYLDEEGLPVEVQDEITRLGGLAEPQAQAALANYRAEHETFVRNFKKLAIDREELRAATKTKVHPAVGIILSAVIVLTLGYLASGFLGRRLISSFDRTLKRVPVVRSIYPYTKQVVDFFLSDDELEFDTVVVAPYPSEGVWAIGFVTGNGLQTVDEALGGRHVSVFIPTSPMPMTGFTVFLDADRLIPLDISVDEALRITVSAGVVVPESERIEDVKEEIERRIAAGE